MKYPTNVRKDLTKPGWPYPDQENWETDTRLRRIEHGELDLMAQLVLLQAMLEEAEKTLAALQAQVDGLQQSLTTNVNNLQNQITNLQNQINHLHGLTLIGKSSSTGDTPLGSAGWSDPIGSVNVTADGSTTYRITIQGTFWKSVNDLNSNCYAGIFHSDNPSTNLGQVAGWVENFWLVSFFWEVEHTPPAGSFSYWLLAYSQADDLTPTTAVVTPGATIAVWELG